MRNQGLKQLGRQLSLMNQVTSEMNMRFAGLPHGTLRGTVCDVDDPENRGRIRVCFDDMNPDIPQVTGAGETSKARVGEKEPDISHWLDVSPAFKGKQPKGLVGKRVNIVPTNGQYTMACAQDVVCDPQLFAEGKQKKVKMPNNSSMTRLPIYESGELPPAGEDNHGCMVVEMNGPMDSDWLCVCLKRNGKYIWVRHVDLQHGHAGENDGKQPNDSAGDSEQPVAEQSVWDYVFPTSAKEMPKQSAYGTSPRPNPYGGEATWNAPPT